MIYRTSLTDLLLLALVGAFVILLAWRSVSLFAWHGAVAEVTIVNATDDRITVTAVDEAGRLRWNLYRYSEVLALPRYAPTLRRGPFLALPPGRGDTLSLLADGSTPLLLAVVVGGVTRAVEITAPVPGAQRVHIDATLLVSSPRRTPLDDPGDGWQWHAWGRLVGYPLLLYLIVLALATLPALQRRRVRGVRDDWQPEGVELDCPDCTVRHDYATRRCNSCGQDLARGRWRGRIRYWVRYRNTAGEVDYQFLGTSWLEAWMAWRRL